MILVVTPDICRDTVRLSRLVRVVKRIVGRVTDGIMQHTAWLKGPNDDAEEDFGARGVMELRRNGE